MKKIFSWIIYLTLITLIPYWVFWNTGHLVNFNDFREGLLNPHTVDFTAVFQKYHFPVLVTLSLYLNLLSFKGLMVFYAWVNNGKIRIGGKSGQD